MEVFEDTARQSNYREYSVREYSSCSRFVPSCRYIIHGLTSVLHGRYRKEKYRFISVYQGHKSCVYENCFQIFILFLVYSRTCDTQRLPEVGGVAHCVSCIDTINDSVTQPVSMCLCVCPFQTMTVHFWVCIYV